MLLSLQAALMMQPGHGIALCTRPAAEGLTGWFSVNASSVHSMRNPAG